MDGDSTTDSEDNCDNQIHIYQAYPGFMTGYGCAFLRFQKNLN